MVATVVRLRLRILGHILRRERWRLVVLVAGVVWVVAMLPSILGAQVWLSQQSVDVAGDVLVIAGSLLVTGWAVVPMLLPTLDDSLEPARFATFAVPVRRLTPALLVAAMVGVPTAFTALLVTSPALGWAAHGPAPALVALAAAPVALVTCLLAARLSTGLFGLLLAAPRAREIGAALVLVGLALGVPTVRAISGLGLEGVLETVPTVARVLGWTPLGLVWAAPAAMADGDALGALGRLVAGSGAALLGLVAWTALLKRSLVRPAPRGGRERRRADVMLPGPARPGRAPDRTAVVTRAVARRAWRYWTADPRYQSAMLAAVLAPVVMVLLVATVVHAPAAVALSMGPFMAATIGWGRHNDVAMDGSAFWMHVGAAVP
ncbi:MAG: ABC transporter permease, partial [Cellulomonadaceae bacterium]|nr:ABC transporter permease [Cellulomonadaceae bacterium]